MTLDRVVRKSLSEDFTLRANRKPGMGLAALSDIISLSFLLITTETCTVALVSHCSPFENAAEEWTYNILFLEQLAQLQV